jgi:hypothetical protein
MDSELSLRPLSISTAPCQPVYEQLDHHAHRANALIRAWEKARNVNIWETFYIVGKSGIDLIGFCNDLTDLRSNCHYTYNDIEDIIILASSEHRGSSYKHAYACVRGIQDRLGSAIDGFGSLISLLDSKIEHESHRWDESTPEVKAELMEQGLPLDLTAWDGQKYPMNKIAVVEEWGLQGRDEVQKHPSTHVVIGSHLRAGVEGRWAKDIECLAVRWPPPPLVDLTDNCVDLTDD